MAIIPSGMLSEPVSLLQLLFASSLAWQTWLSVESDPEPIVSAKLKTFLINEPAGALPDVFGRIDFPADFLMNSIASMGAWRESGELSVDIRAKVLSPVVVGDYADECFDFLNNLGGVLEDIQVLARAGGHLLVNEIRMTDLGRSGKAEKAVLGDWWGCTLSVGWGVA